MTPDGIAPGIDRHSEATVPSRRVAGDSGSVEPVEGAGRSGECPRRVFADIVRAREEILRAHAETVRAIGQLRHDRARLSEALVEARGQHAALFFVGRAVDALATPARPAGT
jgi:hypothetical protein